MNILHWKMTYTAYWHCIFVFFFMMCIQCTVWLSPHLLKWMVSWDLYDLHRQDFIFIIWINNIFKLQWFGTLSALHIHLSVMSCFNVVFSSQHCIVFLMLNHFWPVLPLSASSAQKRSLETLFTYKKSTSNKQYIFMTTIKVQNRNYCYLKPIFHKLSVICTMQYRFN